MKGSVINMMNEQIAIFKLMSISRLAAERLRREDRVETMLLDMISKRRLSWYDSDTEWNSRSRLNASLSEFYAEELREGDLS